MVGNTHKKTRTTFAFFVCNAFIAFTFLVIFSLPHVHRTLPGNKQILSNLRCAGSQDTPLSEHQVRDTPAVLKPTFYDFLNPLMLKNNS